MSRRAPARAAAAPAGLRPRGAPGCLAGLAFVRTGDLAAVSDDQLRLYVATYGGRLTGAVSGRTSYLIVGADPGRVKQEAAARHGVPSITEAQFFDLVAARSAERDPSYDRDANMVSYEESLVPTGAAPAAKPSEGPVRGSAAFVMPPVTGEADLIANKSAFGQLRILVERRGVRAILLHGPAGTGKTACVRAVASQLGCDIVTVDGQEALDALRESLLRLLGGSGAGIGGVRLLVFDSPEHYHARARQLIVSLLQRSRPGGGPPPIFVTSEARDPRLRAVAKLCEAVQFRRASRDQIAKYVKQQMAAQGVTARNPGVVDLLAEKCGGDIRRLQGQLALFGDDGARATAQSGQALCVDDYTALVPNVFRLAKYVHGMESGYQHVLDCFYADAMIVHGAIIQNYQAFGRYQMGFLLEAADALSLADCTAYHMFSEGDWAASRSCAVLSVIVCGLWSGTVGERGFIWPQFPEVIGHGKAAASRRRVSGILGGMQVLSGQEQLEFSDMTVRTLNSVEPDELAEFMHGELVFDDEILDEEMGFNKLVKKWLKNNIGLQKVRKGTAVVELSE